MRVFLKLTEAMYFKGAEEDQPTSKIWIDVTLVRVVREVNANDEAGPLAHASLEYRQGPDRDRLIYVTEMPGRVIQSINGAEQALRVQRPRDE